MSTENKSAAGSSEKELKTNPIWILSPMEEKALLKEHQAWAEKQCETQYDSKLFRCLFTIIFSFYLTKTIF